MSVVFSFMHAAICIHSERISTVLPQLKADEVTCVQFRADRWYPIANGSFVHEIKIYDYYEPG